MRRGSFSLGLGKSIALEYFLSFCIAFLFFFGIFLVNQLIVIARDVLSKQVDTGKALLLLVYSMPAVVALAFPFGSLVGALLTVGRLGADNEFLAMQAIGYGVRQVFVPVIAVSLALSAISFSMNNVFLPMGTIAYRSLLEKLLYSNTELVLQPYTVTRFSNTSIVTDKVSGGEIGAIVLFDNSEEGRGRVLAARSGKLDKTQENAGILRLNLKDVTVIKDGTSQENLDVSQAQELSYVIKIKDLTRNIRNTLPSEMSFIDIYKRIVQKETEVQKQRKETLNKANAEIVLLSQDYLSGTPQGTMMARVQNISSLRDQPVRDRDLQIHWVEYWKKLSIPAACTTLVFLGIPLGLFARKSARGLGLGLGLVVAAIFWGGLLFGQFLALANLSLSPFFLMWAPNFLFFGLGVLSFIPLLRR